MAGAIANDLMTSIRRGQTVATRNETQLRGILKQAETAQKAGPAEFAEWLAGTKAKIVDYGVAVEMGNKAAAGSGG